jgi:hypothetical protein
MTPRCSTRLPRGCILAEREVGPGSVVIVHVLAIRQYALGLTKKHNFISSKDDRKRKPSGDKQAQ